MKNGAKTFIGIAIILALVACFIIFYPTIKNFCSGAQLYTYTDVQQAHEDGYNEAKTNEETYKQLLDKQKEDMANMEANHAQELKTLEDAHAQELEDLETEKNAEISALQTSYSVLQKIYTQLTKDYEALQAELDGSTTDNTTLQAEITTLENRIIELELLLEAYEAYSNMHIITYTVEGKQVHKELVNNASELKGYTPENTYTYNFIGWSLDDSTVIDITTTDIQDNTTFIAVLEYLEYSVSFYIYDRDTEAYVFDSFKTYSVGDTIDYTAPTIDPYSYSSGSGSTSFGNIIYVDGYEFVYWSEDASVDTLIASDETVAISTSNGELHLYAKYNVLSDFGGSGSGGGSMWT